MASDPPMICEGIVDLSISSSRRESVSPSATTESFRATNDLILLMRFRFRQEVDLNDVVVGGETGMPFSTSKAIGALAVVEVVLAVGMMMSMWM